MSVDDRIPALFIVLGLLLGPLYSLLLPPLQAPDEVAHFFRAYILSEGHCVAEPNILIPEQVRRLQTLYPVHLELSRRITAAELGALARTPLEDDPKNVVGFNIISVHACVPYLPAAAVINIARHLHAPALDLMYLGRLANLATYLAAVYLALRMIPGLKLLLFALALMPMTLHQAASLSADSLTFAASFLLCAYILKLAFGSNRNISSRDLWSLSVLVVVVSFSKFAACLVPLILLLPPAKFRSAGRRWIFIGIQLAIASSAVLLWQYLNLPNVERFDSYNATQGIHMAGNLQFVYRHPVVSATTMLRTLLSYPVLQQFVGNLGWLCVPLPAWDVAGYASLLCLVALTQNRTMQLTALHRAIIATIVAAGTAAVFILIWSFNITEAYTPEVLRGTALVPGIQGRYFIPLALPALLLLSNQRLRMNARLLTVLVLGLAILSSTVALNRIWHTYYVPSSSQPGNVHPSPYEGQLVRRPGNAPEDIMVYIIRDGKKHWITDKRWIIQNGFRWPEDVKVIPQTDLDPIPSGEPFNYKP